MSRPLNVLIWHVHGAYLLYLTQSRHRFYVPSKPDRKGDYVGRWGHQPWGRNVIDVPVENVKDLKLDCVIYQLPHQYERYRHEVLSAEQRRLPHVYLEHEPPHEHATEKRHLLADDKNGLIVHVTHFNRLMWDNGPAAATVIEHGVLDKGPLYTGEVPRGVVALNNIADRGRRGGYDIYRQALARVPLDLVGMGTQGLPGGRGEVIHRDLPMFEARYRFYFQPMRYASLALAVCEAMTLGLPVVGVATTEMTRAVPNGVAGFVDTAVEPLIERMRELIAQPKLARALGQGARRHALERYGIGRFVRDWEKTLGELCS